MKSERILRGDQTTETFLGCGLKRKTVTRLVKYLQARLLQLHQLQFLFGSNDRNLRNKEKKKKRKVLAR